jgi:hypothetical protein
MDPLRRRLFELQATSTAQEDRSTRRKAKIDAAEKELLLFFLSSDSDGLDFVPVVERTSRNPFIDGFDLVRYWTNPTRASRYPAIFPLVMRVLVCSLSNTDIERVSVCALAFEGPALQSG